jgi:hypothetical protein
MILLMYLKKYTKYHPTKLEDILLWEIKHNKK